MSNLENRRTVRLVSSSSPIETINDSNKVPAQLMRTGVDLLHAYGWRPYECCEYEEEASAAHGGRGAGEREGDGLLPLRWQDRRGRDAPGAGRYPESLP